MAKAAYIDIEALKTKPKLSPADFPSRKEALDYAEARFDSVIQRIGDLESDMVFLDENPRNPSEVQGVATKWVEIARDIQEEVSKWLEIVWETQAEATK